MLINILYLIIGIALTLVWIKVIKQKTPLNFQEIVKDKFWLIITGSLIVAIGYLYFYLPQVFEWLAVEFWGVPSSTITEDGKTKVLQLTDLGPLGDIYGSLNTLFTSATLAFVIYATLLQRQANNDAREAMAKQLRQVRNASRKQLRQAQLSTKRQLALAQATHNEQIRESQYAIFNNAFYALLALKENKFNDLEVLIGEQSYKGNAIFKRVTVAFKDLNERRWKDEVVPSKSEIEIAFKLIFESKNEEEVDIIYSYFLIYESLYDLIRNANFMNIPDKYYYKRLISNSMRIQEQITLCYISSYIERYHSFLEDSHIFGQFYLEEMSGLVRKYHKPSYFFGDNWINVFIQ